MITIGFSLFPAKREIFGRQKEMIIQGEDLGYNEIFFEIGKPILEVLKYAKELLSIANTLEYYSFVNVTPDILIEIGASPANMAIFKQVGFSAIRIAHGFKISDILKIKDIGIELNPHQFPLEKLEDFLDKIDDPERIKASHNYYSAKGSGITISELVEKSKPFVNLDISVGAFISIPSVQSNTTVEELRAKTPAESAKILLETGVISRVLIGDPNPSREEMENLASIKKGY